jgi:hypothetical protein
MMVVEEPAIHLLLTQRLLDLFQSHLYPGILLDNAVL